MEKDLVETVQFSALCGLSDPRDVTTTRVDSCPSTSGPPGDFL